jgi:hypothetical protein
VGQQQLQVARQHKVQQQQQQGLMPMMPKQQLVDIW